METARSAPETQGLVFRTAPLRSASKEPRWERAVQSPNQAPLKAPQCPPVLTDAHQDTSASFPGEPLRATSTTPPHASPEPRPHPSVTSIALGSTCHIDPHAVPQLLSRVRLFAAPRTAARQASLSHPAELPQTHVH